MKVVFVAMGFHLENTHSTHFLIDILKSIYPDLIIITDGEAWLKIPKIHPDKLFIFQVIFSPEEIDSWGAKEVTFFPMYDACPHTEEFWNKYKQYKIFSFSKTLYIFLSERDFNVCYSQYFIKPNPVSKDFSFPSVFYWERSPKITWKTVKTLISDNSICNLHYHYSTNVRTKNEERPSSEDINHYNIAFSDWFTDHKEYESILNNTSIYIAPRDSEGIGMSFLEAMANGCVVIAYDAPTMNEYITDGVNGLLFSDKTQQKLDLSAERLKVLSEATIKTVQNGYNNWIESIPRIKDFFDSPMQNYNPHFHFGIWLYHILHSRYIYVKLKILNRIKH